MNKLPEILFNKWLQKLVAIDTSQPVTLIHVSATRVARLSGEFLRYDTRFTGERGFYDLTGLDHIILLIFMDSSGAIFTTLRPITPDKLAHYQSKIGQPFKVRVRESVKQSPHYAQALAAARGEG
jgi:hypothetical protein